MARCPRRHVRYQRGADRLPRYVVTAQPILVQVIEHDPPRRGLWDTLRVGVLLRHDATGRRRLGVAGEEASAEVERFAVLDGELAGSCVEWLVPGAADPMGWLRATEAPVEEQGGGGPHPRAA
jgi:hypothetical protein